MIDNAADTHRRVAAIREIARPVDDYRQLVEHLGKCQTVLIGEATHGTHEFYSERARITRRLIEEYGFGFVAIEGDWPDTERVNQYVTSRGDDQTGVDALSGFERFPAWMWRNADVLEFVGWLSEHNQALNQQERCTIHGLDLYSLHASARCVLDYLAEAAPEAVQRARERYECLDGTTPDPQRYAHDVMLGLRPSCEHEVLEQLVELTRQRARLVASRGQGSTLEADDSWFDAQQNAHVVRGAERYYRRAFSGSTDSWNLRDRHMTETLVRLQQQRGRRGASPKAVVWAHNSHVGDARATEMGGRRGQLTLGQLIRQEQGDRCALVGMTTYHGSVTAARDWDTPAAHRRVLPALTTSYEHLFHQVGRERFMLLPDDLAASRLLAEPLLERAIGVIYRPETERESHYFHASIAHQFDAVIHIDSTRAVEPLEHVAPTSPDELAETWPFGT